MAKVQGIWGAVPASEEHAQYHWSRIGGDIWGAFGQNWRRRIRLMVGASSRTPDFEGRF